MKKASGNVFRPWDDASGGGGSPVLVKTELPKLNDEQETFKKDEHEEEEEDSTSGPDRDREPLGLESGLAIAMRGLVGSAGRWNLGGCLRGLMLSPQLRLPLSGPVTGPQPRPPLRGQPSGSQSRPPLLAPTHPDSRYVLRMSRTNFLKICRGLSLYLSKYLYYCVQLLKMFVF
jgi:hypothetical protein